MNYSKNYCDKCDEIITGSSVMRFDQYHKPQHQPIEPKYCPKCGNKLTIFTKWTDERKYWY